MTDDSWRRRRDDEDADFGPPLFGEGAEADASGGTGSGGISFGDSDTGPLPHWTQPPTGEVPRTLEHAAQPDPTDDLDVWSSFSGQSPTWREGGDDAGGLDDITGLSPVFESSDADAFDDTSTTNRDESAPVRREPGRITIGTDPTDGNMARPAPGRRGRPGDPGRGRPRPGAPARQAAPPPAGTNARDMPTAVAVGVGIAAVFVAALLWKPWAVAVLAVIIIGLGAVEYFDRVREKGYQPAFVPGIVACVAAPVVTYHYGIGALPLVLVLTFAAVAVTFIASPSIESNPMPNMAITALGVAWIGVLGSFSTAILTYYGFDNSIGTDTLCIMAIAIVANDVGALFVGSSVGRTPLRAWISPNKSIEGLVGGTLLTLGAMVVIGMTERSDTWNSTGDLLLLGLTVSIAAPIGDLTESMFKRNLDVKDFGSIVKGHGGVLDRFDGFLLVMPAVFYLLILLEPFAT